MLVLQSASDRIAEELDGEELLIRPGNGSNGAVPSINGSTLNGSPGVTLYPLNGSLNGASNGAANGAVNGIASNGAASNGAASNGAGPRVISAGCAATRRCRRCAGWRHAECRCHGRAAIVAVVHAAQDLAHALLLLV